MVSGKAERVETTPKTCEGIGQGQPIWVGEIRRVGMRKKKEFIVFHYPHGLIAVSNA